MRYLYKTTRTVVKNKYKILEWITSSVVYNDPGIRIGLDYIYNYVYKQPEIQDIKGYFHKILYYKDTIQTNIIYFFTIKGFFFQRLPMSYIIIYLVSFLLAKMLGSWLIFFYIFGLIFFFALLWGNMKAWTIKYIPSGQKRFAYYRNLRKKNTQKYLIKAALRIKYKIIKKNGYIYLNQMPINRRWTLGKTNFHDYTFNDKEINGVYMFAWNFASIKHHLSYFNHDVVIDPLSRLISEQEMFKNFLLSGNILNLIENEFKQQNFIVGKGHLEIKKIYAKDCVYDHINNTKILLASYTLCWINENNKCDPILALGPWAHDLVTPKLWYMLLDKNVYLEAFNVGYRIIYFLDKLKITKFKKQSLGEYYQKQSKQIEIKKNLIIKRQKISIDLYWNWLLKYNLIKMQIRIFIQSIILKINFIKKKNQ